MKSQEQSAPLDFPRIKVLTVGNAGVGKSCVVKRYCEGRFITKYIPTIGIDYGVKKMDLNASKIQQHRQKMQKGTGSSSPSSSSSALAPLPTAVRVNFWDAAGGPESLEVRNEFYAPAQGIVMMYDVRDRDSFNALDDWLDEISTYVADSGDDGTAGSPISKKKDPRRTSQQMTTMNTPAGKVVGMSSKSPIVVVCGNKVDDVVTSASGGGGGNASAKRVVSEAEGREWAAKKGCAAYYEMSASADLNITQMMETLFYDIVAKFM